MNKKLLAIMVLAAAGFTGQAFATNSGVVGTGLGAQSETDLTVKIQVPERIQIKMTDTEVDYGMYDPGTFDPVRTVDSCVRSSTPTYAIEITSANAFEMVGVAATGVAYSVTWGAGGTSQTGVARDNAAGFQECDAAADGVGRITITIDSDMDDIDAGDDYEDTLTFVVTAE